MLKHASGAVAQVPGRQVTHRESDDAYAGVVVVVTDNLRVVECADGMQWCVQRLRGSSWYGISFCSTRVGLVNAVQRRLAPGWPLLPIPPHALVVLQALPERHA
jgi:hypothetical protein